jgi:hypothetical protein
MRRKDQPRWRDSAEGRAAYAVAYADAQARADRLKLDHGLECFDLTRQWHVFLLPQKHNRYGHETSCQVVHPTAGADPGHGPMATRPTSLVGPAYHGGPWCGRERAVQARRTWDWKWRAQHAPAWSRLAPTFTHDVRQSGAVQRWTGARFPSSPPDDGRSSGHDNDADPGRE